VPRVGAERDVAANREGGSNIENVAIRRLAHWQTFGTSDRCVTQEQQAQPPREGKKKVKGDKDHLFAERAARQGLMEGENGRVTE